jgi:hypothetical protein
MTMNSAGGYQFINNPSELHLWYNR